MAIVALAALFVLSAVGGPSWAETAASQRHMPGPNPSVDRLGDAIPGRSDPVVPWRQCDRASGACTALPSFLSGADGSGLSATSRGGTAGVPLAVLLADRPSIRFFATPEHPLHADGLQDDAPVIQAAIDHYCAQPYGGTIEIPNGIYAIAATLRQPCPNVRLEGAGTGAVAHDIGARNNHAATYLTWIGPPGGTMLSVAPRAATSMTDTSQFLTNADVTGVMFDCNHGLAGTGLDERSVRGSRFHIAFLQCADYGMRMDTVPLAETDDTQDNDVWLEGNNLFTRGMGLYCGGTAPMMPGEEHGNCSSNVFRHILIFIQDGDGVHFGFSDHNIALGDVTFIRAPTAKGRGVVFECSPLNTNDVAYANHLIGTEAGAPVVAQGSETCPPPGGPSLYNHIGQLDPADKGTVEVGRGASITWTTDAGNFFGNRGFGTDRPAFPLDVAGTAHATAAQFDTPLPVASGGTGSAGGPWTPFTPVVAVAGGVGATARPIDCASLRIGKTLLFRCKLSVAYGARPPDAVSFLLPEGHAVVGDQVFAGVNLSTGAALSAIANGTPRVTLRGVTGASPVSAADQVLLAGGSAQIQ